VVAPTDLSSLKRQKATQKKEPIEKVSLPRAALIGSMS
jgi:hypothetical protein